MPECSLTSVFLPSSSKMCSRLVDVLSFFCFVCLFVCLFSCTFALPLSQQWNSLEQQLLTDEVSIPVYFTEETPQILRLHDNIANMVTSEKTASVTESKL